MSISPALRVVDDQAGDWAEANSIGRAHADVLVARIQFQDSPNLLGIAIRELIEAGQYDGVAVGIFQRLGEYLMQAHP